MAEILSFIKFMFACFAGVFIAFMILLALPQSRLRSVCLEVVKWLLAAGMALLVVSPVDVIPDFIPVLGWGDDIGYLVGSIVAMRSAVKERRERALLT